MLPPEPLLGLFLRLIFGCPVVLQLCTLLFALHALARLLPVPLFPLLPPVILYPLLLAQLKNSIPCEGRAGEVRNSNTRFLLQLICSCFKGIF